MQGQNFVLSGIAHLTCDPWSGWYYFEDAEGFRFRAKSPSHPTEVVVLTRRRPRLAGVVRDWSVLHDFNMVAAFVQSREAETRKLLCALLATWRTGLLRGQDRFVVRLIAKFVWNLRFTLDPIQEGGL